LIAAMAAHPILIERPIVVTDKGTVLARPADKVLAVL
jgi:arsenate reductase